MKKIILLAALLLAPLASASAAERSDAPVVTDKITVSKAIDLLNALNALGGHEEIVGQGASQRVVTVPYNLSADTLWAITDDITALRKLIVSFQEVNKKLASDAEAKNGAPLKADSPAQKMLTDEVQNLLDAERPVDKLFHIKRGDLKLGENKIPPQLLSSLAPILDP